MGNSIFVILSTVAAVYAAYLLTCCLYRMDGRDKIGDKVVFPRIVYIVVVPVAFVPYLNFFFAVIFYSFLAIWSEEYRVKSWLFEKPKQKEKADTND